MRCSFCGSETQDLVQGPPGCTICHTCVQAGGGVGEIGERCAFCNQLIGTEKGFLKKRNIQVALRGPGVIICNECLQSAGQVVRARLKANRM